MDLASPYAPIETCCFNEAERKKSPRMDSQPSQSHWMNILPPEKLSRNPLTIRHSASKSFASSSIHHTHVPELVDACGFFNKLDFWRTWGSFPIPRKNCPPARTSPAKDFNDAIAMIRREKILKWKNLLRNKICLLLEGCTFFFAKKTTTKTTKRLWRFKNRRNGDFGEWQNGETCLDPGGWRHCTGTFNMPWLVSLRHPSKKNV